MKFSNQLYFSKQEPDSLGCLLESTWDGQKPLSLNGKTRGYLEDGDEVIMTGYCKVADYIGTSLPLYFLQLFSESSFFSWIV